MPLPGQCYCKYPMTLQYKTCTTNHVSHLSGFKLKKCHHVGTTFCHGGTMFLAWWHHVFTEDHLFFWAVSKNMAPWWWQKLPIGICDYSSYHHRHPSRPGAPPTRSRQKVPCNTPPPNRYLSLLYLRQSRSVTSAMVPPCFHHGDTTFSPQCHHVSSV